MTDETKTEKRINDEELAPSVDVPAGEKVYILVDGLKSGPFTKEQIIEMVQSRDLLVTDAVSVDGHSWFHLHQWTEFDRRSSHAEELPGLPKVNLFIASDKEVDESLDNENEEYIERDAMAGLAYLGNINSGKQAQHHSDKYSHKAEGKADINELPDLEQPTEVSKANKKETYIWGAVLSLAITGILYVFISPGAPNKVVNSTSSPMVKKAKVNSRATANTNRINNRARAKARTAKKVVKAKAKKSSFTKSKAFKNRAPRRVPASKKIDKPVVEDPDDYYYDDGTDPVELDPVRSKLAKETFDPEDENLDEYLDEVDAEREPASEEEDPEKAFEALYE